MPDSTSAPCMGWMPDLPSIKDYDTDSAEIKPLLAKLKGAGAKSAPAKLATSIDLRAWCSPIENQGSLGSCTANAGVRLVDYFQRRAYSKHIDGSQLFTSASPSTAPTPRPAWPTRVRSPSRCRPTKWSAAMR